ncbi:MAG TPA: 3-mercaptopyruvate sulfurtransferase [Stellaceae bacterium]|nr:3-mercaptopyruvate sulfurtransferase [Stellaceae bacterium]
MSYAHPEALVSTEWLAAHLDDPKVAIVDGSFTLPGVTPTAQQNYASRHLAGAVFFDIDQIADHGNPLPHMLPTPDAFARAAGALGLGDGQRIVVYDLAGLGAAPRVWWMLRIFGHADVAVLDGGLPKWLAEGRPVTQDVPHPPVRRFTARFDPRLVRSKDELVANLASRREVVVDARSGGRFAGTAAEPRPGLRAGHIPGSVNLPSNELADAKTKTVLGADALAARLAAAGLSPDRPVVASCGSGVSACVIAFGMHLVGWPAVAIYDGSWSEWGLPGDTPIATGPAG